MENIKVMEKKIEDYLPLYLGCKICYSSHHEPQDETYVLNAGNLHEAILFSDQPILRPLSDMTEKECDDFGIASDGGEYIHDCFEPDAIYGSWSAVIAVSQFSERINEMRKRHIDVDGLIEAGLAIDSTTINQPQSTT
jgi:hypothetical protein